VFFKVVKNKVFTIKAQLLSLSAVVLLSVASSSAHAAAGYVSDQLRVPLRSGASNGHRIIKFLRSGTALTIVGTDGDYSEVQTTGGDNKGWILSQDIMSVPSGRDRLVSVNAKLAKSKEEIKKLKSSLAEVKKEIKQLKNDKGELQNERTNLSNSLDDLKITAANPVAMSKKNKQLKKELEKARANEAMLDKDNQQLRSNVMQEWFVIGGAVSIGSLILGLILTRINWRRKRDSWGDSF
jgi:SH3 domain protein